MGIGRQLSVLLESRGVKQHDSESDDEGNRPQPNSAGEQNSSFAALTVRTALTNLTTSCLVLVLFLLLWVSLPGV